MMLLNALYIRILNFHTLCTIVWCRAWKAQTKWPPSSHIRTCVTKEINKHVCYTRAKFARNKLSLVKKIWLQMLTCRNRWTEPNICVIDIIQDFLQQGLNFSISNTTFESYTWSFHPLTNQLHQQTEKNWHELAKLRTKGVTYHV